MRSPNQGRSPNVLHVWMPQIFISTPLSGWKIAPSRFASLATPHRSAVAGHHDEEAEGNDRSVAHEWHRDRSGGRPSTRSQPAGRMKSRSFLLASRSAQKTASARVSPP